MKEYRFYGWETADIKDANDLTPRDYYGILRLGGNYHCFNVVDGCVFDLTSEPFRDEILDYSNCPEQFRETHFAKEEKRLRYEYLRTQLLNKCSYI